MTKKDEGLKHQRKRRFVFDDDGVELAIVDAPAVLAVGMGNSMKVRAIRRFAYLDKALVEHFFDPSLLRDELWDQDAADVWQRARSRE